VADRIILDLCGGTGSWSKPYRDAGYDVRVINTPDFDVRTFTPPRRVHGVLAAPPCTMFSLARQTAATPRDLRQGMETVDACLRIIWECQYDGEWLKWWALENPKGLLRMFMGTPTMTFQPNWYGDPHTKSTDLWGRFNTELVRTPADHHWGGLWDRPASELPPLPPGYVIPPDMREARTCQRSMTPAGFAKAFFDANP
jgi:hypothetical protein